MYVKSLSFGTNWVSAAVNCRTYANWMIDIRKGFQPLSNTQDDDNLHLYIAHNKTINESI